jgi:hypothetical protein
MGNCIWIDRLGVFCIRQKTKSNYSDFKRHRANGVSLFYFKYIHHDSVRSCFNCIALFRKIMKIIFNLKHDWRCAEAARMNEVKMQRTIMIACFLGAVFFFGPKFSPAANDKNDDILETTTDYTYRIGPGDSQKKYEALGLFGAKYKAVVLAAKYLSHKGLLENYGKKQKEIFCLAVNELKSEIVEKKLIDNGSSFYIKIKTKVDSLDFIKAEIKDLELEKDEKNFSLQDKMEQHISKSIDPAQELSRAFRYIRRMQWRIAIIDLEHLERKYPNWSEIYLAKAIAFYAIHETQSMLDALKTSCSLGSREACEDIAGLTHSDKIGKEIKLNTE